LTDKIYKRWRKPNEQATMYNLETLATLATKATRRGQTKQKIQNRKLHISANLSHNAGLNPGTREG